MMNFISKQFIDVIEWDWQNDDILMWRYPFADNEIQNGASLTVRDGQVAVFINEGQVADIFSPGRYTLNTQTLPILTNLKNWDKLFVSPFKSDVLFFNTRLQQGRKWGTAQSVTMRDSDFGMVRIRAFGMYNYRISDVAKFYQTITGMDSQYQTEQIEPQLRNLIIANLATSLGQSKVPFIDLASNQLAMGNELKANIQPAFAEYGLSLESIIVENVSLPEELQKTLDKRISTGMIGDLNAYTRYQTAEAIPMAAQNEGGIAGIGAGLGIGMNMANMMAGSIAGVTTPSVNTNNQAQPPVSSQPQMDFSSKLTQLKTLLDQGLISQTDFDDAKNKILAQLTQ